MEASEKSGIWVSGPRSSLYGGRRAPGGKTRLLIVDDHDGYRHGLASTFSMEPGIEVVGQVGTGEAAIEQAGQLRPDVVLMDINLPGMDGIEATRRITDTYTGIIVVVLTMHKGEEHLREARRAGASAYVMKDAGADVLVQTIHDVMHGHMPLLRPENGMQRPAPPAGDESGTASRRPLATGYLITSNERAILRLLADGLTNDQIAQRLNVPTGMVRTYLAEIGRKIGLAGRDDIAEYARTRLFNDDAS
jgi:DNA-binding NarL/FixJ family response regulator